MSRNDTGSSPPVVIQKVRGRGCLGTLFLPLILLLLVANLVVMVNTNGGAGSALTSTYAGTARPEGGRVAIVDLDGSINDASADRVIRHLRQVRDDKRVKAVVFRVDSPGGTVTASDRIWREVNLIKARGKPIVVSMGSLAASGGYYVSAPADFILAEPTTLTGSIGVIMELPNVEKLMEKVGVGVTTIKTGGFKDVGSLYRAPTEEERKYWDAMIDHSYQRFVRLISQGRGIPESDVRAFADGRVFHADQALANRLIDQIGYLDDAIIKARALAQLPADAEATRFGKPFDLSEAFGGLISAGARDARPILERETEALRTPRLMATMR